MKGTKAYIYFFLTITHGILTSRYNDNVPAYFKIKLLLKEEEIVIASIQKHKVQIYTIWIWTPINLQTWKTLELASNKLYVILFRYECTVCSKNTPVVSV